MNDKKYLMNKLIKFIPNLITLTNLLFGIFAVIFAMSGWFQLSGMMIAVAAVFDFLDGFAARLLKATSGLGKELDSLSDMVSFGLAPGLLLYNMIEHYRGDEMEYVSYLALLVPLFSAYRLAKFNVDERQSDRFFGLPTPANALVIASFPWIASQSFVLYGLFTNPLMTWITNPAFLGIYALLFSILLVVDLPLFALKVKTFTWNDNKLVYSFLIFSLLSLAALHFVALPWIIVIYILLSIVDNVRG